jgi:hypothetical protein
MERSSKRRKYTYFKPKRSLDITYGSNKRSKSTPSRKRKGSTTGSVSKLFKGLGMNARKLVYGDAPVPFSVQDSSARTIQRAYDSYKSRKERNDAASVIQRHFRNRNARRASRYVPKSVPPLYQLYANEIPPRSVSQPTRIDTSNVRAPGVYRLYQIAK